MADPTFGYRFNYMTNKVVPQLGYSAVGRERWTTFEITAFDSGVAFAIEKFRNLLHDRICFDFKENQNCDHSVCHGNAKLLELLEEEFDE
jgi:hypothetical protein